MTRAGVCTCYGWSDETILEVSFFFLSSNNCKYLKTCHTWRYSEYVCTFRSQVLGFILKFTVIYIYLFAINEQTEINHSFFENRALISYWNDKTRNKGHKIVNVLVDWLKADVQCFLLVNISLLRTRDRYVD